MLRYSRTFLSISLVLFVATIFAWGATYSRSFTECESHNQTDKSHAKQPQFNQAVARAPKVRLVPLFLRCQGAFIDENNGTLTAIATIAIAAFTLTLWRRAVQRSRLRFGPGESEKPHADANRPVMAA